MTCGECPWFRKPGGCTQEVVEWDEECGMRLAFRILRDEYRWRQEERACMALAHGFQIANLLAPCPRCKGQGQFMFVSSAGYSYWDDCPRCWGTGRRA